ncbi:MAG: hypothetical protein EZS28_001703 [Streblomastix strix]|uniref:Uncharacterized protein n=1 Tax=Streblomastix strix TaxID=222440 RepID=A0A5J4X6G6_9EUKA|nr:MAG: hypothetical protein EZS28_001703 [Streblomastix strix]
MQQRQPFKHEAEAEADIHSIRKARQQRIYGPHNPMDLIQEALETRAIVEGKLDPQAARLAKILEVEQLFQLHQIAAQRIVKLKNAMVCGEASEDSYTGPLFGGYPLFSEYSIPVNKVGDHRKKDYPYRQSRQATPVRDIDLHFNTTQDISPIHQETAKNTQYLRGFDWGLDLVNKYYGKTKHISKQIDYYLQDEGALTFRQRKVYLAKEEKLNNHRPRVIYIKASEMQKQVEAQQKMIKKYERKKKTPKRKASYQQVKKSKISKN